MTQNSPVSYWIFEIFGGLGWVGLKLSGLIWGGGCATSRPRDFQYVNVLPLTGEWSLCVDYTYRRALRVASDRLSVSDWNSKRIVRSWATMLFITSCGSCPI